MKLFKSILFVAISLFTIQFASAQENNYERIKVGAGPEDFVLDNFDGRERLIISCSSRRPNEPEFAEIVAYDINTKAVSNIKRTNEPDGMIFNPHGIDLKRVGNELWLFVVNHPRPMPDEILIYQVMPDHLILKKTISNDLFVSINCVVGLNNGNFYISNDSGKKGAVMEKLLSLRKSNITYYDIANNQAKIVKDKLAYANGVAVKNDKLYIAATQKKDLLEMTMNEDGTLKLSRKLDGKKGMDNITINGDLLFVTAHPKFLKFIKHVKKSEKKSPSEVYMVDLNSGKTVKVFYDKGNNISAAATALLYKNQLYLGQVFDDFLLKTTFIKVPTF
jgi:hypothetical protein